MKFIDLQSQMARVKKLSEKRIATIFESAMYINGPDVIEFEKLSSNYLGYGHGIGVASGTDALMISLMALGVDKSTRVFLPAYTYTATAEVICLLGAQPIYIDVNPNSYLLDLSELENALKIYAKPNDIIMTVDLFGEPCDYDAIQKLTEEYRVDLVIDGAQSFGNKYKGSKSIAFAKAFCTSFFPAKPLGCAGDGGAIYTNDEVFASTCRSIKNHGMGQDKYDIKRIGINGRLDTVQAAVLIEKLAIFDDELMAKRKILECYSEQLTGVLTPQTLMYPSQGAIAQAVFSINGKISNTELQIKLKEKEVPSMIYYPKTIADQSAYKKLSVEFGELLVSRGLCSKTIALPMHAYLTDSDVDKIVNSIIEITK
jgi:dTDP-4-amino-4,6-dideoxygalactose transaminase